MSESTATSAVTAAPNMWELMEMGQSCEIVKDEIYSPIHPSRDWIQSFLVIDGPGSFRMLIDGKKSARFMLSAKQYSTDGSVYISTNESFSSSQSLPSYGYCARLDRQSDRSFTLSLNSCHLCDNRLRVFRCGRSECEREVVAKISAHMQRFKAIDFEYRCFKVKLPFISKSGKRKIWCPRAFRNSQPDLSADSDVETCIRELPANKVFQFRNQVPGWNAELRSLVVRFQGTRTLTPSARNFLLSWATDESEHSTVSLNSTRSISPLPQCGSPVPPRQQAYSSDRSVSTQDSPLPPPRPFPRASSGSQPTQLSSSMSTNSSNNSTVDSPSGKPKRSSSSHAMRRIAKSSENSEEANAVLQFGKITQSRFALDFRYPISPLQAFGIALASFASEADAFSTRRPGKSAPKT